MAKSALTRAIKLTGTDVAEGKRRMLTAGPISAMFDNGAIRSIRFRGVEVLRGIAYLARDKDWATYTPAIENLKIRQGKDRAIGRRKGVTKERSAESLMFSDSNAENGQCQELGRILERSGKRLFFLIISRTCRTRASAAR